MFDPDPTNPVKPGYKMDRNLSSYESGPAQCIRRAHEQLMMHIFFQKCFIDPIHMHEMSYDLLLDAKQTLHHEDTISNW